MSVAAQTLYERENPFHQAGPGHKLDLSDCTFEQISEREVHVGGSRFIGTDDYWVKLEGARVAGYRSICIAGIRCPSMIGCIDDLLADAKRSEEHTSELQSLMRISYAVFCLKKKTLHHLHI